MKNKFNKKIYVISGFLLAMLFNFVALNYTYAQVDFPNPIKATDIRELVKDILDIVVDFGAIVVVFFLVYAGFLFVKAQGNPGEIKTAKEVFFWTIVGGMIVLGAHVLSRVIQNTVNQIHG